MKRKDNLFTHVPQPRVKHNVFDLSHEVKMSGKFSFLYPVLLMDCLPGEHISEQAVVFGRYAPLLSPMMHKTKIDLHAFFVPDRLCVGQTLWEKFITGGQDGTETPVLPYVTPAGIVAEGPAFEAELQTGRLWDYLGLPTQDSPPVGAWSQEQISARPFFAYGKIWNDWFRDPNLDTELSIPLETEGNVSQQVCDNGFLQLRARGWNKDYFTAALPFAQRGTQVMLPLSGTGSVTYEPTSAFFDAAGNFAAAGAVGNFNAFGELLDNTNDPLRVENIDEVTIDNSTVSINDFTRALALQRWMENSARGGGRYIEQMQSHYGHRVPDFRLQRSEYIGRLTQPFNVTEVLATAETVDVPVGDLFGRGTTFAKSRRLSYTAQEHGWCMIIASVTMDSAYSQGIERMWSRQSKFDFAFPELANIGEQAILSKELFFSFANADNAANQATFGYIPRFAEYKFKNDRIAGDFRTTLNYWHLSRNFTARPVLDTLFTTIQENLPAEEESFRRVFANQDGTDYIWLQIFHNLTVRRPLPYFGVPRILG